MLSYYTAYAKVVEVFYFYNNSNYEFECICPLPCIIPICAISAQYTKPKTVNPDSQQTGITVYAALLPS